MTVMEYSRTQVSLQVEKDELERFKARLRTEVSHWSKGLPKLMEA